MNKLRLQDIFAEDPFGLLDVQVETRAVERTAADKRLIESFEEINSFYEENGRAPAVDGDVAEFMLASRLAGIKASPEKVKILLPFDFYDILQCSETKSITVEDILSDDPLNLLNPSDDSSIFTLKHVKKSERLRPDYISRRNICKNFDDYKLLFDTIHADLRNGKRKLTEYHESDLKIGGFYVLRGVLLYLESGDVSAQEFDYESGSRTRDDGRTRCIFDNGTESNMLFRSLGKALAKDGFGVSEPIEKSAVATEVTEQDVQNGYIYVLSSLSNNPQIAKLKNLHKVGYCSGDITERIKNAKNEPTYLMEEVKVELAVRCYNLDVHGLESTLHSFFKDVNVAFEVYDQAGAKHYPREWFIAPLSVIQEAVALAVAGSIADYRYDQNIQAIIKK